MKKNIIFLLILVSFLGIASPVLAETITLPNPLCPTNPDGTPKDPDNCIQNLPELIAKITKFVSDVVASLAVLMFLWAGILFLTSAGDMGRLGKAKNAGIWAGIGLAVALAGEGLAALIKSVIGGSP